MGHEFLLTLMLPPDGVMEANVVAVVVLLVEVSFIYLKKLHV
jgi:hypothetical protein